MRVFLSGLRTSVFSVIRVAMAVVLGRPIAVATDLPLVSEQPRMLAMSCRHAAPISRDFFSACSAFLRFTGLCGPALRAHVELGLPGVDQLAFIRAAVGGEAAVTFRVEGVQLDGECV